MSDTTKKVFFVLILYQSAKKYQKNNAVLI